MTSRRVLLVFIDGVGYGAPGPQNPFDGAPVSVLAPLGSGPGHPGVVYGALDATLGHAGLPQSATGQASLFTGDDAIALVGGHMSGYPTPRVAALVARRSVLARAREGGRSAAFLNGYDDARVAHLQRVVRGEERPDRRRPPSASSWAALAGGGSLRTFADVRRGRAATFDLTGELLAHFGVDAPRVSIADAARAVARGAAEADVALFELFLTDKAGHAQDVGWARHEISRTDLFLRALLAAVDPREQLVILTSDHGNLEDLSTRSHTRNAVPLAAYGRDAADFVAGATSLLDVAPRMLLHSA